MSITLSLSLKWFFFLFPRITINGPAFAVSWLGVCLAIVQKPAAGIITPEQMPLFIAIEKRLHAEHKRRNKS